MDRHLRRRRQEQPDRRSLHPAERFIVTKASPAIATSLVGSVGQQAGQHHRPARDGGHRLSTPTTATADCRGTVHYQVFSNATCTTKVFDAGTKTVSNHLVPNSDPYTVNSVGTYYWQADYSGDANNNAATSPCNLETSRCQPGRPTVVTARLRPRDGRWLDLRHRDADRCVQSDRHDHVHALWPE